MRSVNDRERFVYEATMRVLLRFLSLLFFFMVFGCKATSQLSSNPRAKKEYEKGIESIQNGDLQTAVTAFEAALSRDTAFVEAHIRLGAIAFSQNQLGKSRKHLTSALQLDSTRNGTITLTMARISWMEEKYGETIEWVNKYLMQPRIKPGLRREAEKLLRDANFMTSAPLPADISILPLSDNINSKLPEYLPTLTADEQMMIFTRRVSGQEDFYVSQKQRDQWSPSYPLHDLNTKENEGAHCLSADGTLLILTGCNKAGGLGSCDLYFSQVDGERWSKPKNLGSQVNSSSWDSQPALSANNRKLYFSSERKGGAGGRDLWMTQRTVSGWSPPVNVTQLNTPFNEEAPFLHADQISLYFMSDGHAGYGGTDLFISRRIGESWSQPQNLGAPMNTPADEGALHINLAGDKGYFARALQNDIDIFSFSLSDHFRPTQATFVVIQALDARSGDSLQATVKVNDLGSGQTFEYSRTNTKGELLLCITIGKEYGIQVDHPGYSFYSSNINLEEAKSIGEPHYIKASLWPLDKISVNATAEVPIILRNVFFESGLATLLAKSHLELDRLRELLIEKKEMHIQIRGHTDSVGTPEDNQRLSENRAEAVYNYLVHHGVSEYRLTYIGMGEDLPIASNETEEGRALNRRTEFVMVKKEE